MIPMRRCGVLFLIVVAVGCAAVAAQTASVATVPPLIKVSGTLANTQGTVGVTFALYAEQTGGAPLWLETQNVTPDANGRYTIYLGANHANGVPLSLFASGEAQWLGVQPEGQPELPRAQLVSVPYALTAGDAQTLGGQPLSAFVLASSANATTTTASGGTTASAGTGGIVALATPQAGISTPLTTTGGLTGYLAKFTSTAEDIENSLVYDTGTAVGIGTTAPAAPLHVVSTATQAAYVDVYSNALTGVSFSTRAARGTPTVPSAVQTNDVIGGFTGKGYYGTPPTGTFSGGRGSLIIRANEPWTPTAQSTYIQFNTAPLGQAFQTERMRIDNAGNVGINTVNPGGAPVLPLAAPVTLEVNGNVKMTAGSGGGITFQDGSTQTTAFTGTSANGSGGVTSINSNTGAFTFTGAVSCTGTTCNFTGVGGGVSSINSQSGAVTFTGPGVSNTGTTFTFSSGGSSAFSALTGGANTTAAMVIGSGASLTTSGTGSISATNTISATATDAPGGSFVNNHGNAVEGNPEIGLKGACITTAVGNRCYGVQGYVADEAGQSGGHLVAGIFNPAANASNTPSGYSGLFGVVAQLGMPTSGIYPGSGFRLECGTSSGTCLGQIANAFWSMDGLAVEGVNLGASCYAGTCNSQQITMNGMVSGVDSAPAVQMASPYGDWYLLPANGRATYSSSFISALGMFGFAPSSSNIVNDDTGISRIGASVVAIGNGTPGDASGTLKAATVNATSGYRINGSALAFSDIAGTPSTTQVPFQSLTTTGTNGAAMLSGGVLNIPQYSGSSGSMTWPGGTASGILNYSYPNAWNSTTPVYNASNPIPATFVSPVPYGPIPCPGIVNDGATDNTTALNACAATGKKYILPSICQGSSSTIKFVGPLLMPTNGGGFSGSGWGNKAVCPTVLQNSSTSNDGIDINCAGSSPSTCLAISLHDLNLIAPSNSTGIGIHLTGTGGDNGNTYHGDLVFLDHLFITGFAQPIYSAGFGNGVIGTIQVYATSASTGLYLVDIGSGSANSWKIGKLQATGTSFGGSKAYAYGALRFRDGVGSQAYVGDASYFVNPVAVGASSTDYASADIMLTIRN